MDKTEGTVERIGGYRVVRRLAAGGTSDVLLAKAEGPHGFERSVVLKVLLAQHTHDDQQKGMFAREAAAYARLSHPSIVRLYDFFATGDQLVMVLEYIDGPPLSRLRGMLRTVGQQFEDGTALYIAGCIFDALAAGHAATNDAGEAAPVIHRDVNPSNVLIPWDAQVKLADFGIAKVAGLNHQSTVGLIKGTYGYMAPEQVKGELISPRADVYAGAIILWEMLTKRRAFIRGALPEVEVLRQLAEPRIVSIDVVRPDLGKGIRHAIKRALEPSAEKRTITAEELVSVLRSAMPSDEGREKLAKALSLVRHEPMSSATSMPPAMMGAEASDLLRGKAPSSPSAARPPPVPRLTPAPRPAAAGVPRTTAPYGAVPPAEGSGGVARAPAFVPPRPHRETAMGTHDRAEVTAILQAPTGAPPSSSNSSRMASSSPLSSPGLASLLEPSPEELRNGRGGGGPGFGEPGPMRRDSEKLRLGMPLAGGASGRPLREAIDEILRDMPSNLPPGVFPKTDPPAEAAMGADAHLDRTLALPITRELGQIPAAPAPLMSTLVAPMPSESSSPPQQPSSFPAMNRTLAMSERALVAAPELAARPADEAPTGRPPRFDEARRPAPSGGWASPDAANVVTAPLHAVPMQRESARSAPPVAGGSSPPATLPFGAVTPSFASAAPSASSVAPPGLSYPPPHGGASGSVAPGARLSFPQLESAAPPPRRRGALVATLAALVVAGMACAAAVVGYWRWQDARALASRPSASATPAVVSSSAPISRSPFVAPAGGRPPRGSSGAEPAPSAAVATPATSAATTAAPAAPEGSEARPSPSSAAAPSASVVPAAGVASAAASAVASAAAGSAAVTPGVVALADGVPAGMGRVKTTGAAPGRRIFVDERTVGQTPDAVIVKCGTRAIKVGSSGVTRPVDVPCGGEITVGDR